MSIARKILLGYGLLLVLVFINLVYALSSLDKMGRINEAIININSPIHEQAGLLVDNLLGQEFYSQRLLILKDKDSFELLQMRIGDFDGILRDIRAINSPFASVRELVTKAADFRRMLSEDYGSLKSALALPEKERESIDIKRQELLDLARHVVTEARQDQDKKIGLSAEIGARAYGTLLVFGIGSVLLAVGITMLFARSISRAVGQLKLSTKQISDSRFGEVKCLERSDEFGEVSKSITEMAKKLQHLEKLYLATNPLTLLPGGLAIDDTLKTRLDASIPTAVCIIDLDNFKVFNDRYGYARGNEVIQTTANIITSSVKRFGGQEDFIGHIGGDDFMVMTSPERYEAVCKAIISSFDEKIPALYDEEDRKRGAIVGKNRQGAEVVFPMMSISIAVVTDQKGAIKQPHVLSRRAAELKEHAKSLPGSIYVVDKRHYSGEGDI